MKQTPQELTLAGAENIAFDALEPTTLFALATYEGDLEVATCAISELSGRVGAGVPTMAAVRQVLASSWADRHLKAAALDAAFVVDAAAAAELAHGLLRETRDPVLVDAMIHGVMGAEDRFDGTGADFLIELREVAASVRPTESSDAEAWARFVSGG